MPRRYSILNLARKTLFVLLFIVASYLSLAQNADYNFEKLSVKDGLSHSNVYSIIQDQLGFMWFGTQDGLNKYNGYDFTIYRHESSNPNSLSTGNFGKIHQDSTGILWFGTYGGGIDRFDPTTNTFTNFSFDPNNPKSLSSNQILFIFEDSKNQLWIGTANGGLNRFNKEEQNFTRFQVNHTDPTKRISSNRANCMCETKDGMLWIGTTNGLNKYDRNLNTLTQYSTHSENNKRLTNDNIQHLYTDQNDLIWIASNETGLSKFNPATDAYKNYKTNPNDPSSINDNNVEFIFEDSYGTFWIGTHQGGLNKFNPETEKFVHFIHDVKNPKSISNNRIEYIYEDASKILWIATRGGGLNKLDLKPRKFNNLTHDPENRNSLPHPSVMAIATDQDQNIWIGTDGGGLTKYNPKKDTYTHFQHNPLNQNSLSVNSVWSILVDQEGIIWAGTYRGGLNRIEFKNGNYHFTHYLEKKDDPSSISSNQVNTILQDQKGTIWIATSNGLNKLIKSDKPENYSFKQFFQNSLDSVKYVDNYIGNIFLDEKDRLWVGAYAGGLFQFLPETEKFINYSPPQLENSEFKKEIHVLVIFEDHNKNLWLGTESNGIIQFDEQKKNFTTHPKNEELLSNMIVGILEDDMGNLWVSSSRGLSKHSPWNNKINNYSFNDGIVSSGFNRNAVLKCKDGRMYFGSNLALTHFYPLEVGNNPYPPQVAITDFKILNQSEWKKNLLSFAKILHENQAIELSPQDYFFTIEFAALDYTFPQQNYYKYMLEGFDQEWINSLDKRAATYTNLDPGIYTFKVKGSNSDKVWNENPTEIKIKVIPAFYKTWWFYVLIVFTGLMLIFFYIKIREQSLIKEKESLERKVNTRTNEIHLQKEELKIQAENLEKINKQLENHQERLERLVLERTADLEISKEKAEESDRLKSAFLANMSHEIRTPMNAIIGFSNLINDENIEKESRLELTSLIKKNSHVLLNLIDDIIDIAKIESDQLDIREKKTSLNKIFNELLMEFNEELEINQQLTLKVSEEQLYNPLEISADPYRLSQILKNLISNAIKFTEKGFIEFGYELNSMEKQVQFFVKDTGIGLTEEQQKQIFSRFTKIETHKQKIYRGAGLGLTITKNLVELMGGEIHVQSEIHKGSTFHFTIPYKPLTKEAPLIPQPIKNLTKFNWVNKNILIAEDEESNFKFLEMVIRKTAADILWAKTGKQAIEICQGNYNIDLILMDIKMPEMDGLEAIRELREQQINTPIIVQSAYSMPEDRNLSFESGANDFISKPIGTEKLLKLMDKYLNLEIM